MLRILIDFYIHHKKDYAPAQRQKIERQIAYCKHHEADVADIYDLKIMIYPFKEASFEELYHLKTEIESTITRLQHDWDTVIQEISKRKADKITAHILDSLK
jgi:hypothetical protein